MEEAGRTSCDLFKPVHRQPVKPLHEALSFYDLIPFDKGPVRQQLVWEVAVEQYRRFRLQVLQEGQARAELVDEEGIGSEGRELAIAIN